MNVLFLVPEIALTTQLVSRLKKYFPNNLHVYHSGINPNLRYEIWNDLKSSAEPKVVLGARSSIFLPFNNVGLIIVDEENEVSYKQFKSRPLYNARDLAVYLSKLMNSRCILASATPSLESFHNSEIKKYSLVQLNKRYGNFESPELIFDDPSSDPSLLLSPMMISEIKKELENNKQIIIFRNRRGYSTYIQCSACLNVDQCPNCDVSLTFHINKKLLKCHYCGYSKDESITCSKCGLQALEKKGVGTQLIEKEINSLFPDVRVARLDYDTTRKKSSFKDIISRFEDNEFQIFSEQIISEKTANDVLFSMREVIEDGTGILAKLENFDVSGKTGTTEKLRDGNYKSSSYTASFIGIGPNPSNDLTIFVNIDGLGSQKYSGGSVAAPLFKKISNDVFSYMGYFNK